MSKEDPYFQFPLCLLSMPLYKKQLSEKILDYCIYDLGNKILLLKEYSESSESYTERSYSRIIERTESSLLDNSDDSYLELSDEDLILFHGLRVLLDEYKGYQPDEFNYIDASEYIRSYEIQYGNDALVRMKKSIFISFCSGSLPERSFRLLAGLYSVIGSKKYCCVTYDQLQYRMLGFKSSLVFEKEKLGVTEDMILSKSQIGRTMRKLETQNFFVSTRPTNRKKYYSIRLDFSELYMECFKKKTDKWKALQIEKSKVITNLNNTP